MSDFDPNTFAGMRQLVREDLHAHGDDRTRPGFKALKAYRFGVWRMNVPQPFRAPLSIWYRRQFRRCRDVYGIELPYAATVGRRLVIEHQHGIVVHGATVIGDDCTIRQGVTLGNKTMDKPFDAPTTRQRRQCRCRGESPRCRDAWRRLSGRCECRRRQRRACRRDGGRDPGEAARRQVVSIGIVAIGRNEGDRAKQCLQTAVSFVDDPSLVVYVDSGSTDGSPDFARSLGVTVVDLDLTKPFTAARARNAGYAELSKDVPFVQFLDADCELVDGWLATAVAALEADEKLAGVAGLRRERFPDATVYNKLCDLEWNTPTGEAKAVGGDAMFRRTALDDVGGYDPTMIAGEEPEMCIRLRSKGWTLRRIESEMTLHDAAMTSWKQWWNRNKRAGHAYAETLDRHPPTGAKEVRSNYLFGLVVPLVLVTVLPLGLATFALGLRAALLAVAVCSFPMACLLVLGRTADRVKKHRLARGDSASDAATYAKYVMLGKVPQAMGQLKYRWNKLRGRRSGLIEYKG